MQKLDPSEYDYSLQNVVGHLTHCIDKCYAENQLILQIKYAKPTKPTEGNKEFESLCEKSHENVQILNANRAMKQRDYVRFRSDTSPKDFDNFVRNIAAVGKSEKLESYVKKKLDATGRNVKCSFSLETLRWSFKDKYLLFRPNYEAVLKGKFFRIALTSQKKQPEEPSRKLVSVLKEAIEERISCDYQKQEEHAAPIALRFKEESYFNFRDLFQVIYNKVYQVEDIKLYENVLELVNHKKGSASKKLGEAVLSEIINQVLDDKKLTFEVELRVSEQVLASFEVISEEQIEQSLEILIALFEHLSSDENNFSSKQINGMLGTLQKLTAE